MISPDDPRAPKYWMYEESGVLRPAVEAYLNGEPLTAGQIRLMRLYLKQWIDSPVWDENPVADEDSKRELAELRRLADAIETEREIADWIECALDAGIDPL